MTTLFLARKFMTTKLDRSELKDVKWLRKCNLKEKHKTVETLQKLLKDDSIQTCRLCLMEGKIPIFCSTYDGAIARDIEYALGFQVNRCDGKPQYICNSCLDALKQAVRLKTTAEASQWRLQQESDIVLQASTEVEEIYSNPKIQHGGYFTVDASGTSIVREWICKKCRSVFHSEVEYAAHRRLPDCRYGEDSIKKYICEYCGKPYNSIVLLRRHRIIHTGEPGQFKCSFCTYRSHDKYRVRIHERWHTGEKPLRCTICYKTFSSRANLWTHKKIHQPPKYHCEFCPKSYTYKMQLRDHLASQHGTAEPFGCEICGKTFATRKRVLKHERGVHNRPLIKRIYTRIDLTSGG